MKIKVEKTKNQRKWIKALTSKKLEKVEKNRKIEKRKK